jgi:hypothetical protein
VTLMLLHDWAIHKPLSQPVVYIMTVDDQRFIEVENDELISDCTCEIYTNPVTGYCVRCEQRMNQEGSYVTSVDMADPMGLARAA